MNRSGLLRSVALLAALTFLTACKSDEEKGQELVEAAQELLDQGDSARASIQLRNALELLPNDKDARLSLAGIYLADNQDQLAYREYLRVAEQFPNEISARVNLAELAFEYTDWEEFRRHGTALVEANSELPRAEVIELGLQYQQAVEAQDLTALEGYVVQAEAMIADQPDNIILVSMLMDGKARDGAYAEAISYLDQLIAAAPDKRLLQEQRLALVVEQGIDSEIQAQLRNMVTLYPEDAALKVSLVRFHMSRDNPDGAEAFLRELSDPTAEDTGLFVDLVQFLAQVRGPEAARAELEAAVEAAPENLQAKALLAAMDFEDGRTDAAIAALETLIADREPNDEINQIKVGLARMMVATGNEVGARALVEAVIASDAGQVEALKMQAEWQLAADDTDAAIASLRRALDNAPSDAEAMTLMSEVYVRTGASELSRDFLALAVEASGNAPTESLRYARVLLNERQFLPAEDILLPALRLAPGNIPILAMLGELYIAMEDNPRTEQVIATLRRMETPEALRLANSLEAEQISARSGPEEVIAFLEGLAAQSGDDFSANLLLLRAQLEAGETDSAVALISELVAERPENLQIASVYGGVLQVAGRWDEAETVYRDILAQAPQSDILWLRLSQIVVAQGDPDAGFAVVEEGLGHVPDSPNLLWAKASFLERRGMIDETIAIYDDLYAKNSGSVVIANNLASTLATYKDDAESLEKARRIARRLEGATQPALQDTYGWILSRLGQHRDALTYLEPAAEGLRNDPLVQYHLAATYVAAGRDGDALPFFQRAIDLAGPADTRPQINLARAELERINAAGSE